MRIKISIYLILIFDFQLNQISYKFRLKLLKYLIFLLDDKRLA